MIPIYFGNDIQIEEMLQGCVISNKNKTIVISSPKDALEVIKSLKKMLRIQHPREYKRNKKLLTSF